MKLAEAIDIGKAFCLPTIGAVDDLICHLYNNYSVISEAEIIEYIDDYEKWRLLYQEEFPNREFADCKI